MEALVTVSCHVPFWLRKTSVRSHGGLDKQAFIDLKYFTRETLGCECIHVDAASRDCRPELGVSTKEVRRLTAFPVSFPWRGQVPGWQPGGVEGAPSWELGDLVSDPGSAPS